MAFIKQCDNTACGKLLGNSPDSFLQIHGSISEQREPDDGSTDYRYLTPYSNSKVAFCDVVCMNVWIDEMQNTKPFITRQVIPNGGLY